MRASQLCHEDVSQLSLAETDKSNLPTRQSSGAYDIQVSPYFLWKSAIFRVMSAMLFIGLTPLMAVIMMVIRCNSKGSPIYRQERVGKDGRVFTIYKFRSMHIDAESQTGPVWATTNDDRTTSVGRFLRRSHLDELPQLINVVRGDMDLFGPRPERPEFAEILAQKISEVPPAPQGVAWNYWLSSSQSSTRHGSGQRSKEVGLGLGIYSKR